MGEGADAHDVAVLLAGHRRDLDDVARDLRFRHRAIAVAFIGDLAVVAVRKRRANHRIFIEADRRLQRAADEEHGKDAGQNRGRKPSVAHAPPIRRPVGNVAGIERFFVAEIDERPLQAMSLESCQYPRLRSPRLESRSPLKLAAGIWPLRDGGSRRRRLSTALVAEGEGVDAEVAEEDRLRH